MGHQIWELAPNPSQREFANCKNTILPLLCFHPLVSGRQLGSHSQTP